MLKENVESQQTIIDKQLAEIEKDLIAVENEIQQHRDDRSYGDAASIHLIISRLEVDRRVLHESQARLIQKRIDLIEKSMNHSIQ